MGVASTSATKMTEEKQTKGNKNGIRVAGRRIYDSEAGQSCHQVV